MAAVLSESKPSWQAEVKWETRFYRIEQRVPKGEIGGTPEVEAVEATEVEIVEELHRVSELFVHVFRPGCQRISFLVNRREGRGITFTDPRERNTGTAGTTGLWGTRPPAPAGKPRSLTPTAFKIELARFIGAEQAEKIVRGLLD